MANFTERKFGQIKADVAGRLGDTGMVFFTNPEIGFAINEAIRVFQILVGYWREQFTVSGGGGGSGFVQIANPTLTDANLITEVLYHMIENPVWPYAGTDMFVTADFTVPLERRRNQFLAETGIYLTRQLITGSDIQTTTITLPQSTLSVERLAWQDQNGVLSNLWETDQYDLNSLKLNATSAVTPPPFAFSASLRDTRVAEFAPVVSSVPVGTQAELIGAQGGSTLDGSGVVLGVPNDFCWILKYGHMADLLDSDGQARDPNRAKYCEMRYRQGTEMTKAYKKVFRVTLNGYQFDPASLQELDARIPGWQNVAGSPNIVAYKGGLIAMSPNPSGPFSFVIDRYADAPVMVNDNTDYLQIDRGYYDIIVDYAVHCSMFKMAGAEFVRTMELLQNMMQLAGEDKPWSQYDYRKMQPWEIDQEAEASQQSQQQGNKAA